MAKDYDRRRPVKQKTATSGQLMLFIASFFCGYLVATVFDFSSLSTWVKSNILAETTANQSGTKVAVKKEEPPKPKFEFYTLLAKEQKSPSLAQHKTIRPSTSSSVQTKTADKLTDLSKAAPVEIKVSEAKSVLPTNLKKEAYLIQIAAFRNRQDAEQLKIKMTLKGFDVIVTNPRQASDWYRVVVGPFASKDDAEKTRLQLAKLEHINGMIRKMDA